MDQSPDETKVKEEEIMLTRIELDKMRCPCGCDSPVFLRARCHPKSKTWTSYWPQRGALQIRCAHCGKLVCEILVAPGPAQPDALAFAG